MADGPTSPASPGAKRRRRMTVPRLRKMKAANKRITMLTAYDATFAKMFDDAEIDMLLVGDSLGMVVQGQDSTLPVTLDEVIYHCRAVARGATHPLIVGDMPFMSYQVDAAEALRNAGRFLSEGGAHAVKLEGGISVAPTIARIVEAGIPVMAHVGLTPQSVHAMGGFRVQGKTEDAAERILADARAVQDAGAFALVLEGIPAPLAARITEELEIPTIGIGAGVDCDGQVLVSYDLLGLTPNLRPKFVKRYAEMFDEGVQAAKRYAAEGPRRRVPRARALLRDRKAGRTTRRSGEQRQRRAAPLGLRPERLLTEAVRWSWSKSRTRFGALSSQRAEGPNASGSCRTMGALHAGHLSLVSSARAHGAEHVAVTIFVNPLQFAPDDDFERYPRTLEADLEQCRAAGVATVFAPPAGALYPDGFSTRVLVDAITVPFEGVHRPGHFDGVTTVVAKLMALTGPSVAVFGKKDYQQLKTLERMTRDLSLPVEVVGAPIVREPDGLALSSRNRYLSAPERQRALGLVRGLIAAHRAFCGGERDNRAPDRARVRTGRRELRRDRLRRPRRPGLPRADRSGGARTRRRRRGGAPRLDPPHRQRRARRGSRAALRCALVARGERRQRSLDGRGPTPPLASRANRAAGGGHPARREQ